MFESLSSFVRLTFLMKSNCFLVFFFAIEQVFPVNLPIIIVLADRWSTKTIFSSLIDLSFFGQLQSASFLHLQARKSNKLSTLC